MNLSYWERKNWLSDIDLIIIGSGIVGLNCGLAYREQYPDARIVILEKGMLPQGASTKNAGFACFGSLSEIISDLKQLPEQEVLDLIEMRWSGLDYLRKLLGDKEIGYQQHGGYELFLEHQAEEYEQCLSQINTINQLLYPIRNTAIFQAQKDQFQFGNILPKVIYNPYEGQIETGQMMQRLLQLALSKGILILNGIQVETYQETSSKVEVKTPYFTLESQHLAIATNGFSRSFLDIDLSPARAQILITQPIQNLHIQGTFHIDEGYYYFRNIDNRILFGGARNLAFEEETTTQFGETNIVQNQLEKILREVILPQQSFQIEHRWSGIMGMGGNKKPIIQRASDRVAYGVRLGGMGIAIGSMIGRKLAKILP